ncbi:molecular chaperone DnaJ [Acinetobacter radioresistens]|uniref:molecular chaperone DnaJ n=2 Tax=Acinetobacter radioresistens TaxID=40216 RepID=UPI0011A14D1E|nr:molecular chaperone DnaJ [Acinetobacter radioresistens]MCK4076302.1 molecular chaperone DnaJ [Acinetobacter radioresistens]MCK4082748.1 molecular chaperone DnaJ [Acinetobacter radioresistens]MCK4097960.1 molecular chaperone DnaJ [Acinetobacter radioresistens]MCU4606250.1 molecular chaperone DnaJ [Acinetobacter radioresistens]MCU4622434.1 molecular chaperone DnaJ [Acinetobacter radioresistens]
MALELKNTLQPDVGLSPQQRKLNRLIDKIEKQQLELKQWQQAQEQIQQYTRQTLMPVYQELHAVLFQQLEQLWKHLHEAEFSKAEATQLDVKIQYLAAYLKNSQSLSRQQTEIIDDIYNYYQQHIEHTQARKNRKQSAEEIELFFDEENNSEQIASEDFEEWDSEKYSQTREQAKLKRQQEKLEQATKLAEQSLKTVYLKIAATIHPDREPDESKKVEKTELLQRANEAYAAQDLFYLLKLQIQIEQNRGVSQKGLSAEQLKFHQLALDMQSQKLDGQIEEIIQSLSWNKKGHIGKVKITDLYKQVDVDTSAMKKQLKGEKERLKYMKKVSGVEMLLEHGVL